MPIRALNPVSGSIAPRLGQIGFRRSTPIAHRPPIGRANRAYSADRPAGRILNTRATRVLERGDVVMRTRAQCLTSWYMRSGR